MNNYITLDSYKYYTSGNNWQRTMYTPRSFRITLAGSGDSAYGSVSNPMWVGEIIAPVTSPGTGWGTVTTLRTSLAKLQNLSMTDHYGTTYTVFVQPLGERSKTRMWDGASNKINFAVEVKSI